MRNTLLTLLLLSSVLAAHAAENTADPAAHDLAWVGEAPAAKTAPVTAANGAVHATNLSGVALAFAPDPGQSDAAAHEEEFKQSMLQLTTSPRLRSAIGLIYDERTGR